MPDRVVRKLSESGGSSLANGESLAKPGSSCSKNASLIDGDTCLSFFGALPGIDSLVASLRTCEVAAEATRAIGERFLSDACTRSLVQMNAQVGSAGGSGSYLVDPVETTVCQLRRQSRACTHEHLPEVSKFGDGFDFPCEANAKQSKREPGENKNVRKQKRSCSPSNMTRFFEYQGSQANSSVVADFHLSKTSAKRRKESGIDDAGSFRRRSNSEQFLFDDGSLPQLTDPAFSQGSVMGPSTGRTTNALGGLRALGRRYGAAKQSRMSRRLECFRREAEEALRGQHNETVMGIFSTIDGHIRSFRGGSMSPSELDLRIMEVIDKCLPLQGDEAKAVEAVLDMVTVRRLKTSLEGRPKNSGGFLDLIALSKLCRHIPGVCFDKWNLGWIATWREHRRPVHKHFSAKKYGFFRAREFAICYRSKMTSDIPVEGADPPTSPRSIIAQGDLSPLLSRSTGLLSDAMALQKVEQEGRQLTGTNTRASTEASEVLELASGRRSDTAALSNHPDTTEDGGGLSSSLVGEAHKMDSRRVACVAETWWRDDLLPAATSSEQQRRSPSKAHGAGSDLTLDAFVSRDGWADLVARTPRVERVSFDFTNQSWIAQWKQHGRTTYRRFAVSKYGFATAHRLAVEYKSKYFKETIHQCAALPNSSGVPAPPNSCCAEKPCCAPAREGGGCAELLRLPNRRFEETVDDSCNVAAGYKTGTTQTDLQEAVAVHQQQTSGEDVQSRSGFKSPKESSNLQRGHQQQSEQQVNKCLLNFARRSASIAKQNGILAAKARFDGAFLQGDQSGTGNVSVLETLIRSSHEEGEMCSCSEVTRSSDAGRDREGTSTTTTPTSHTHISVDAFPVNTQDSSVQQQTTSSPSDAEDREMRSEKQELQRTLLKLIKLQSQTWEAEKPHPRTRLGHQDSNLASGAPLTPRLKSNYERASLQGVGMLRTAINCILLDLRGICMHDAGLSEGKKQVYLDLIDYHMKIVDEAEELEALAPYNQCFSACLQGKMLPSSLSAFSRTELFYNLENLFMQHQHKNMHDEQLMHFLVMQAQQQRRLQHQQAAADLRRPLFSRNMEVQAISADSKMQESQDTTQKLRQRDAGK